MVLRLELGQALDLLGHVKLLPPVLLRDLVQGGGPVGGGRGLQLAGRRAHRLVPWGGVQHFVALAGQHGVQLLIRQRPVALLHLPLPPHGLRQPSIGGCEYLRWQLSGGEGVHHCSLSLGIQAGRQDVLGCC